ncbi:MAG: LVIVD repeat-containing protein [Thermoplasmatota archaeon]
MQSRLAPPGPPVSAPPGMRAALLAGLMIASAFVGCISANIQPIHGASAARASALPSDWYEAALNHDKDHNHSDINQHMNLSTPNFHLLGHDPLLTEAYNGTPAYGYGCGEAGTTESGRTLFVVNAFQNSLTFVLEDVTDARHPIKVGEFYEKGMGSYDADITPDGRYVVLAFDQQTRAPVPSSPTGPTLAGTDASGGASGSGETPSAPRIGFHGLCADNANIEFPLPDAAVATAGIVLVDVSDPAHPKLADWDPMPGRNLHSVSTALVNGVDWVIGSELGGALATPVTRLIPGGTGLHALSYFVFDEVQATTLGTKLVRVGTYDSPPATFGSDPAITVPIRNGHTDATMLEHPISHKLYAYLADWEGGVLVLDMSMPAVPRLVAQWTPPHPLTVYPYGDSSCYRSAIHEVLPANRTWDGHYYIFAGQECPLKTDTTGPGGSVFVLDFTDPTTLKLVGSWHLPEDTGVWTTEYQASPHYLALVNRTLLISDYHAGLWAADVSNASDLAAPPSIGVYIPAIPGPKMPKNPGTVPFCEQVEALPSGAVVLTEDTTGLYVLHFDASDPAPAAPPYQYST